MPKSKDVSETTHELDYESFGGCATNVEKNNV